MVILRGCPRCRGDLAAESDIYGEYLECVQCGYVRDLTSDKETKAKAESKMTAV